MQRARVLFAYLQMSFHMDPPLGRRIVLGLCGEIVGLLTSDLAPCVRTFEITMASTSG